MLCPTARSSGVVISACAEEVAVNEKIVQRTKAATATLSPLVSSLESKKLTGI